MTEVKWAVDGIITDEAIEKHRSRLGSIFKTRTGLNEYATKGALNNFVNAIGDPNPLWRDEEYAKKSPYRCIVASPSFLYSISYGLAMQGLRGVHGFHSGSNWEFLKPVMMGDKVLAECMFTGLEEKRGKFAERMLIESYTTEFRNQRDDILAKLTTTNIRAERRSMKQKVEKSELQLPHPWTEDELTKIEDEVVNESIRGSEVRYWEDVQVGDEIPQLMKGPLTITDIVSWFAATVPMETGSIALRRYRKHPGLALIHPATRAREMIELVHFDVQAAKTVGRPYPYDLGAQRHSWLLQSITHWTGDDGWVKRNAAEYRKFVYLSDILRIRGKVTKKYIDEDGDHCIEIESSAMNQRGENAMPGVSIVALPSKEKNQWPVKSRLH